MSKLRKASTQRAPRSTGNDRANQKPPTPRVMTEDQADIVYCEKHKHEPRIPLRDVLRDLGIDESEVGL